MICLFLFYKYMLCIYFSFIANFHINKFRSVGREPAYGYGYKYLTRRQLQIPIKISKRNSCPKRNDLEYHSTQMPWSEIMEKAVRMGYHSHKTNTCGLHIHINRTAFVDTREEQEERISRLLFFMERFWQELFEILPQKQKSACTLGGSV